MSEWDEWREKNPDEEILLEGADFIEANFRRADLSRAYLRQANLMEANLMEANFENANLEGANLRDVTIISTIFNDANLTKADLTGCIFSRPVTFGWNIDGVNCDYIYLDKYRKNRRPKNRNFEPGEFQRLFESIPTVEYVFEKGMKWYDASVMNQVAMELQQEYPEWNTNLLSLDGRGFKPRAVFGRATETNTEEVLTEITTRYDAKILELESRIDVFNELLLKERLQPRQPSIGTVQGDVYLSQGDMTINNTTVVQTINQIKDIVEQEDETTLSANAKKKALEILDEAGKDVGKGLLKKAAEKVFNLATSDEFAKLAVKLSPFISVLKTMFEKGMM